MAKIEYIINSGSNNEGSIKVSDNDIYEVIHRHLTRLNSSLQELHAKLQLSFERMDKLDENSKLITTN